MSLNELVHSLERKIAALSEDEDAGSRAGPSRGFKERRGALLERELAPLDEGARRRVFAEFDGWGPLEPLIGRDDVTEILLNDHDSIWFESAGRLQRNEFGFLSEANCRRMIDRLCLEADCHFSLERPVADGRWRDFRLHVTGSSLTAGSTALSLRRHPRNPWTLGKLREAGWCTDAEAATLRALVRQRWNFLVVGSTGTGKTSVAGSLLAETAGDRTVILEDSDELAVPPGPSLKLLTRTDAQGLLPDVGLSDLLRQSLRLRPDRLVVGEVRGGEAKDLLLALSTGHAGSFGTLHADHPAQALLRLEMLVQMGAPEWGLETVRRLIRLSLQGLIVVGKNERGERKLKGLHRIVSLEDNGFLLEPVENLSP